MINMVSPIPMVSQHAFLLSGQLLAAPQFADTIMPGPPPVITENSWLSST